MFGAHKFKAGKPWTGLNDVATVVGSVAPAVIGGMFGSSAADAQASAAQQASATSAAAADKATALQREMWMQQQAQQQPWLQAGTGAVDQLSYMMGITPQQRTSAPIQQGPDPYAQYAGMSPDQIRAALIAQQPQQQTQQGMLGGNRNALANPLLGSQAQIMGRGGVAPPPNVDAQLASIMQGMQSRQAMLAQQQQRPTSTQQFDPAMKGSLMKPFSMADYQADPGYAFRMKEGMKGLEQGAAARGGVLSGNMLRGAQQYGQDMASQEYQNAYNRYQTNQGNQFNRLASMSGLGQSAVGQLGSMGSQYASNVGNIGMGSAANQSNAGLMAGQARASSMQGMGQALGGVNWSNVGNKLASSMFTL